MTATADSRHRVGKAFTKYEGRGLIESSELHYDEYEAGKPRALPNDMLWWSQIWFRQPEHNDLDEAVAHLPIGIFEFDYNAAEWHHNTIDADTMARAHILRLAHGWQHETALHRFLEQRPSLLGPMGFDSVPDQSALWRAWERFSDRHQDAIREAAQTVVFCARDRDVAAPARAFRTEQEGEQKDTTSERQLTVKKTKQVWKQTRPHVSEEFALDRADNASIPDHAFWKQHSFAGMKGSYIEDAAKGDDYRDLDAPSGSQHRRQVHTFSMEETRRRLRAVNGSLIKKARRKNELDRGVTTAIDFTKGSVPFQGEIERDEDNNIVEPWILGYKDGKLYFQWATIQVVGDDIPIVLDAVPRKRGMKKADVVDELLKHATDMVNIEEVQADRGFDVEGVRNVIDDHGLTYRTGGKVTGLRGKCTEIRRSGALAYIIEDKRLGDSPSRKTVFVPAINTDVYDPDDQNGDEDDDEPEREQQTLREELVEEFGDAVELDKDEERKMFADIREEMHEREEERDPMEIYGSDAHVDAYGIFKTNDPAVTTADLESHDEVVEAAARAVRPYRRRWAIEEGNKKIKSFMAKTKSRSPSFRFFNFAFGTILYNVWRLVDLLVQLSMEMEYDYSPHVTAGEFLTCAEEHFEMDTPPPQPVRGAV